MIEEQYSAARASRQLARYAARCGDADANDYMDGDPNVDTTPTTDASGLASVGVVSTFVRASVGVVSTFVRASVGVVSTFVRASVGVVSTFVRADRADRRSRPLQPTAAADRRRRPPPPTAAAHTYPRDLR